MNVLNEPMAEGERTEVGATSVHRPSPMVTRSLLGERRDRREVHGLRVPVKEEDEDDVTERHSPLDLHITHLSLMDNQAVGSDLYIKDTFFDDGISTSDTNTSSISVKESKIFGILSSDFKCRFDGAMPDPCRVDCLHIDNNAGKTVINECIGSSLTDKKGTVLLNENKGRKGLISDYQGESGLFLIDNTGNHSLLNIKEGDITLHNNESNRTFINDFNRDGMVFEEKEVGAVSLISDSKVAGLFLNNNKGLKSYLNDNGTNKDKIKHIGASFMPNYIVSDMLLRSNNVSESLVNDNGGYPTLIDYTREGVSYNDKVSKTPTEDLKVSRNFVSESNGGKIFHNENVEGVFMTDNPTQNWLSYSHNYSPELKRDTEVIFEEKIINESNGDLENSDYSDQSQSPENSISSNDSTSSSSSDSSSEETVPSYEEPTPEKVHTYRITLEPCRDFQEMFKDINDDEFSGKKYHQPPKALDRDAAKRLARRLYECDGFKITDVAKHLSKRNDFSQIVGEEFANYFDLTDLRLDKALRLFLGRFTLTGETQERERIMHHFSKRYVTCNFDMYNGEDACHTLVCALIILNTNLHSQNQPKMTCNDFILNLKDLNEGENFPLDNLKELYSAIEQEPIRWPMDDELVGIVNMPKQELVDFSKQMINPPFSIGMDLPRDSNCRDFMSGYVVRKWLKEPGGKKAAFGKRGWKLFYGRLRDLTLYLYKDHDKSVTQTVNNVVKHHNSVKLKKSELVASKQSKKLSSSTGVKDVQNQQPVTPTNNLEPSGDDVTSATDVTQNVNPNDPAIMSDNSCSTADVIKPTDSTISKNSSNLVLPPADTEIHINHAYASRAADYVKKKNVFRIKTKYGSEYLFQVNTEKEMDGWIDNINYVAALLSDPEPTIGICTMEKLTARSIPLPKITTLNVRDQLENHQKCLMELEKVIKSLKENTPKKLDKKSRSELEESIKFREDELLRYKTYCQLLEFELVRIQNIVNIRIAGTDPSSFFYQPFQMTGPNQSAHFFNQGLIAANPQMLNNVVPMSSMSLSSSAASLDNNFVNSVIMHPQPNARFRPPPVHQNLAAMSANRRLRYRLPGPLVQQMQSSPVAPGTTNQSATTSGYMVGGVGVPNQSDFSSVTAVSGELSSSSVVVYSPPTTNNTFYEIV